MEIAIRDSVRLGKQPVADIPAFWWYTHCGYDKRWNTRDWGDETLPREFDDYMNEALEQLRGDRTVDDADVERLSPLEHKHISFLGRYSFLLDDMGRSGHLRPLRNPEEFEGFVSLA